MKPRPFLILLLAGGGCAAPIRFPPDRAHGFVSADSGHRYQVYLPADFSTGKKWPVIIYLHGGAERGRDGVAPTQEGLGPVVWRSQGQFPFVVAFPQAEPGRFWAYPDMDARVMATLQDVLVRYSGDPDRVYLTGNSMGGYGTWLIAARHPGLFAALVPICGGVKPPALVPVPRDAMARAADPYGAVAERIGHTPVWAFHGAKDWLVSPKESRRMVAALEKRGGVVRYTEYPDVGHESWARAYAEPELFTWLMAQHRPEVQP